MVVEPSEHEDEQGTVAGRQGAVIVEAHPALEQIQALLQAQDLFDRSSLVLDCSEGSRCEGSGKR